jgi:hypothetical protein
MASRSPTARSLLALAGLFVVSLGCRRNPPPAAAPAEEPAAVIEAPEPVAPAPVHLAVARPQAAPKDPCLTVCARGRDLGCRKSGADCREGCAIALGDPTCATARRAFGGCLVKEPRAHWACDEDGMPALADGFCAPEQSALGACLKSAIR